MSFCFPFTSSVFLLSTLLRDVFCCQHNYTALNVIFVQQNTQNVLFLKKIWCIFLKNVRIMLISVNFSFIFQYTTKNSEGLIPVSSL